MDAFKDLDWFLKVLSLTRYVTEWLNFSWIIAFMAGSSVAMMLARFAHRQFLPWLNLGRFMGDQTPPMILDGINFDVFFGPLSDNFSADNPSVPMMLESDGDDVTVLDPADDGGFWRTMRHMPRSEHEAMAQDPDLYASWSRLETAVAHESQQEDAAELGTLWTGFVDTYLDSPAEAAADADDPVDSPSSGGGRSRIRSRS